MAVLQKITFRLEQVDGYPPTNYETIWAERIEKGLYKIANIPFFSTEVAYEDKVFVVRRGSELFFDGVAEPSENSLVRIIFFEGTDPVRLISEIEKLGCYAEWVGIYSLIAVSVAGEEQYNSLVNYLKPKAACEELEYEEPILKF